MFDFAFAIGIGLIIPMLYSHYHFADKIRKKIRDEQETYAKAMAKVQVDSIRNLVEKYPTSTSPPYNALEEHYTNLFMKQFEGLDKIASALRLESWLSNTMFFSLLR